MKRSRTLAAIALAGAAWTAAAAAGDAFTVSRVQGLPSGEHGFIGLAMNQSGAVVGENYYPDVYWWYTGPDGLGTHYPPLSVGGIRVDGLDGIDDAGEVFGSTYDAQGAGPFAFALAADGVTVTGFNPPGAASSVALTADAQGRVVGTYRTPGDVTTHAFRVRADGSGFENLGTLGGGDVFPKAIRNGVVVGGARTADGRLHAFRTRADGRQLIDLGTLGGTESQANGINDAGDIVGYATDAAGTHHAFILPKGGTMRLLDAGSTWTKSEAGAIDALGHVVGWAYGAQLGQQAFVTRPHGGEMLNLNDLASIPDGGDLIEAVAIDAKGEILANDYYDEQGPWMLTARKATWTAIDRH